MPNLERLLDPTGDDERGTDVTLAPRPHSLEGLTVGLLGNGKTNAELLLTEVAEQLKAKYGAGAYRLYTKGYFGTPATDEEIRELKRDCDVAVAAIGD